jgi:hypothetical protein
MQQNVIDIKLQAARELGLTINRKFEMIDNSLFLIVEIKKDEVVIQSYPGAVDKTKTLEQLSFEKGILQNRITQIDEEIATINGL